MHRGVAGGLQPLPLCPHRLKSPLTRPTPAQRVLLKIHLFHPLRVFLPLRSIIHNLCACSLEMTVLPEGRCINRQMDWNPHYSQWMIRLINHLVVVFVSLSVMICSKSHNNLYRISTFLECLIKLLYLIRSNINNTKFAVVGTLCRKKCLHKKRRKKERKSKGMLLKAVQYRKHELKAPARQQVFHHIE